MDNAQKAIMIGVGLFITIIIIAAVMLITGMGQDLLNQGTTQLGGVSAQLQTQLTSGYDNVRIKGSEVIAAVKKYYNEPSLVVYYQGSNNTWNAVTQNKLSAITGIGTVDANGRIAADTGATIATNTQPSQGGFTNATSAATYIPSTVQYNANLIELNGAVIGIAFKKI